MKLIYIGIDNKEYTIPKKYHQFFSVTASMLREAPLKDLEYLDILELLLSVRYSFRRNFYLGNKVSFKGIGNQMLKKNVTGDKVAFFGSIEEGDMYTLPYREYRKLKLTEAEKLSIDRIFFSFFNFNNKYIFRK